MYFLNKNNSLFCTLVARGQSFTTWQIRSREILG